MHLVVILIIVLVVFGPGKLSTIGSDLGRALREFREQSERPKEGERPSLAAASCAHCGAALASADARYCVSCGRETAAAAR